MVVFLGRLKTPQFLIPRMVPPELRMREPAVRAILSVVSHGLVGVLKVCYGLFDFVQISIFSSPDLGLLDGYMRRVRETYDCDHLIQHRGRYI